MVWDISAGKHSLKKSSEKGDGHVPGPGTGKTVYAEHTQGGWVLPSDPRTGQQRADGMGIGGEQLQLSGVTTYCLRCAAQCAE